VCSTVAVSASSVPSPSTSQEYVSSSPSGSVASTSSSTSSGAAPEAGVAVAEAMTGAPFSITLKWSKVTSIGPSDCCGPIAIRPMPGVPSNSMLTEPGVSDQVWPSALILPV